MSNLKGQELTRTLLKFYTQISKNRSILKNPNIHLSDFLTNTIFVYINSSYEKTLIDILECFSESESIKSKISKIKHLISPKKGDNMEFSKIFRSTHPANILKIILFEDLESISNLRVEQGRIIYGLEKCLQNTKCDKFGSLLFSLEKDMQERRNGLVHRSENIDEAFLSRIKTLLSNNDYISYFKKHNLSIAINKPMISESYLTHASIRVFDLFFYYIFHLSLEAGDDVIEIYFEELLEKYLYKKTAMEENGILFSKKEKEIFSEQVEELVEYFIEKYDLNKISSKYLLLNLCSHYYVHDGFHPKIQRLTTEYQIIFNQTKLGKMARYFFNNNLRKSLEQFKELLEDGIKDGIIEDKFIFTYFYHDNDFLEYYKLKFKRKFTETRTQKHISIKEER